MDVVVDRARPFDGRYPMIPFNRYEQGMIRRLTDWLPVDYEKALTGGDAEFVAALAVLAMKRAGRVEYEDVTDTYRRLLDIDAAEITLEGDLVEEETEPGPPPESSSLSSDISGPGSSRSSETSEKTPDSNGTPDSATSESVPTKLVS
jgi:hypothetical protein